jgi:hypothetical protein
MTLMTRLLDFVGNDKHEGFLIDRAEARWIVDEIERLSQLEKAITEEVTWSFRDLKAKMDKVGQVLRDEKIG